MRGERVKVGEGHNLARKKGIRARAWSGKGGLHRERRKILRRTGRASKKSLPRTSRSKHEWVSGCKSSPGQSAESWFHSLVWPNLRWKRRLGDEEPAHKIEE